MRKKIGTFAYFPVGTNTYTILKPYPVYVTNLALIPEAVVIPSYNQKAIYGSRRL
jgi:hypothetical protein